MSLGSGAASLAMALSPAELNNALMQAAQAGDVRKVKEALDAGAEPFYQVCLPCLWNEVE